MAKLVFEIEPVLGRLLIERTEVFCRASRSSVTSLSRYAAWTGIVYGRRHCARGDALLERGCT